MDFVPMHESLGPPDTKIYRVLWLHVGGGMELDDRIAYTYDQAIPWAQETDGSRAMGAIIEDKGAASLHDKLIKCMAMSKEEDKCG